VPTALHLDFFRASEEEEERRRNAEVQRLKQVAEAQAARGLALEEKEAAQKREAEAQKGEAEQGRRVVRRTLAGLVAALVLAAVAGAFGLYAQSQRLVALNARNDALLTQSKYLTDAAKKAIEQDNDPGTGLLLALEALRDENSDDAVTKDRPYWLPAEVTLTTALRLLREKIVLKGHTDWLSSVAVTPDAARIVTGSADGTARIWDAKSGAEIIQLKGTDVVNSVALTPDGSRIVTGSADGTARIWDAKSGAEIIQLKGHTGEIFSVAVTADGRVVTASADTTARGLGCEVGCRAHRAQRPYRQGPQRGGYIGRCPHRHRLGGQDRADLGCEVRRRDHPAQGTH
jgi:hypothetical protein